jgi:putative membrane protein
MGTAGPWSALIAVPLLAAAVLYLAGVSRDPGWPRWRTGAWLAGLVTVAVPAGPDFRAHMVTHLLLGMAAPLLLAVAAPVTLALRALPVARARRLSRMLRARPVEVLTHPVTAAVLDAGGLWALYTTGLYAQMHRHVWLSVLVHVHLLAAGYLFAAAITAVDPAPHRPGRPLRAVVLLAFLAAHDILAKHLYAHPPAGVPAGAARSAAELMYYGGAAVDLPLIVLFCARWYAATDPHRRTRRRATTPPARPWRLPAEMRRPAGPVHR